MKQLPMWVLSLIFALLLMHIKETFLRIYFFLIYLIPNHMTSSSVGLVCLRRVLFSHAISPIFFFFWLKFCFFHLLPDRLRYQGLQLTWRQLRSLPAKLISPKGFKQILISNICVKKWGLPVVIYGIVPYLRSNVLFIIYSNTATYWQAQWNHRRNSKNLLSFFIMCINISSKYKTTKLVWLYVNALPNF